MSYKILVFDWLPAYLRDEVPEYMSLEELEDWAESLTLEVDDLNHQIRIERTRAMIDNRTDSLEYLSWKERISTRLRVKTGLKGVALYNLRKVKQEEVKEEERKIIIVKEMLHKCKKDNKEVLETIQNAKIEYQKVQTAINKKMTRLNKQIERIELFKNFIFRCIWHLNNKIGGCDPESEKIAKDLDFIPKLLAESSNFGNSKD